MGAFAVTVIGVVNSSPYCAYSVCIVGSTICATTMMEVTIMSRGFLVLCLVVSGTLVGMAVTLSFFSPVLVELVQMGNMLSTLVH